MQTYEEVDRHAIMEVAMTSDEAEAAIYALALRIRHASQKSGGNRQADYCRALAEQIEEAGISVLGWSRYDTPRVESALKTMKRVNVTFFDYR